MEKEFEERRVRGKERKKKETIGGRKIGKVTVSFTTMHDPLNIVSGSLERFINGWPAEIHFPVPYSRRQTTRVPPPLPSASPPYKPFLRNPSVKISISTFHSLHSIPYSRGSPRSSHPLLCLDEVIKDAAAISGASRADEQAENQPTTGLDPRDAREIFFEPLNRSSRTRKKKKKERKRGKKNRNIHTRRVYVLSHFFRSIDRWIDPERKTFESFSDNSKNRFVSHFRVSKLREIIKKFANQSNIGSIGGKLLLKNIKEFLILREQPAHISLLKSLLSTLLHPPFPPPVYHPSSLFLSLFLSFSLSLSLSFSLSLSLSFLLSLSLSYKRIKKKRLREYAIQGITGGGLIQNRNFVGFLLVDFVHSLYTHTKVS